MDGRKRAFDRTMLGVIFALAWPTMLEQLMQTAVQYIDTAMVGTLGTEATAAVGATGTVSWLVMGMVSALSVGFLAQIAQTIGAGKTQSVHAVTAQAVTVAAVAGIFLTVLMTGISGLVPVWMQVDPAIRPMTERYFLIIYCPMLFRAATIMFGTVLRAAGDTKTPMRVGLLMNLVNIALNFLLIYPGKWVSFAGIRIHLWGAGMGVAGAAAASAVSYVLGGCVITAALWRHEAVTPRGMSFLPDPEILKPCFRVALPNMLQRFGTSMGYVVFATMINALGGVATAAHTIANTVESAFYIPGWGMQAAAATLAGNAMGAGDAKRLKTLGATFLPLEIGLMVISGGLLFLLAKPLVGIFSSDPQVVRLGVTVLRMVALSEPFYGVPIVVEGMMQGVGSTRAPMCYNLAGMWGIRILGTYLCTRLLGMGLVAAWGCMIGHNLLLFVLFGERYLRGRWNPL